METFLEGTQIYLGVEMDKKKKEMETVLYLNLKEIK
jgi:hypothetical protein